MRATSVYCFTCEACGKAIETPSTRVLCACGADIRLDLRAEQKPSSEPETISEKYEQRA